MKTHVALAAVLTASACTTVPAESGMASGGECAAEPGQRFVGQRASAEIRAQLLRATGAGTLRWVPPRSAVTMDFRADRLTVSYNDAMLIERVSCG